MEPAAREDDTTPDVDCLCRAGLAEKREPDGAGGIDGFEHRLALCRRGKVRGEHLLAMERTGARVLRELAPTARHIERGSVGVGAGRLLSAEASTVRKA